MEALRRFPVRASERQPNLDAVDEDLPSGPGQPISLEGVNDVDWIALSHAYGEATDIPDVLVTLSHNDERWAEANSRLVSSVLHQRTIYSSTAPTMRLIARIAAAPHLSAGRRLDLLYTLFLAGSQQAFAEVGGFDLGDVGFEVRDAVASQVRHLLMLWPRASGAEQRLLLLLVALGPVDVSLDPSNLVDPASWLAQAIITDLGSAEALLSQMAESNEGLLEYTEDNGTLHGRLIVALQELLM